MGFTQKLGLLAQGVYSDSSLNVGIGGAPSGSYKFETTGTAKISSTLLVSGVATFGSTLSNGTYTYTLPSATGTLALTSDIHSAVTLAAIGSTPNANGATLTGQVLNLQPADGSFGGVVTTGTQTFAGAKTFTGALAGTTATFSGLITLNSTASQHVVLNNTAANGGYQEFDQSGTAFGYIGNSKSFITSGTLSDFAIRAQNNFVISTGGGTAVLTIASTGAATFSGNLSCSGASIQLNQTELIASTGASNRAYAFNLGNAAAGDFTISQGSTATGGTYTTRLTINPTGAATFSSSVTATSFIGNASTATALATARTIAGVSFNGTANISLNTNAITNGAGYIPLISSTINVVFNTWTTFYSTADWQGLGMYMVIIGLNNQTDWAGGGIVYTTGALAVLLSSFSSTQVSVQMSGQNIQVKQVGTSPNVTMSYKIISMIN
jgi:hypothetical protein